MRPNIQENEMTSVNAKHEALLDELLKDYTDPQDILGEHGLLKHLTNAPQALVVAPTFVAVVEASLLGCYHLTPTRRADACELDFLFVVAEPIARRAASAARPPRTQRHQRRSPPTSFPLSVACYSVIAMASTSTRKSEWARRRTSTVVLVGRAPKYSIRTSTCLKNS